MNIPDCRVDDLYNQDFLDEKDSAFIAGFDACLESIKNLIECNLEVYAEDLSEAPDGSSPDEIRPTRPDLYQVLEENKLLLSLIIVGWAECSRDSMITELIESMDDDEYLKNRERAIKENKHKEYYDSRQYETTGEKQFHEIVRS